MILLHLILLTSVGKTRRPKGVRSLQLWDPGTAGGLNFHLLNQGDARWD
jgi:hypothetical protein